MLLYKNNMPNCVFWLIFDAIRRCFRAVFEQNLNVGFLRFKILYNQHNGYPHKRWNVKNILQIKLRNEELVITFNFALKEGSWYRALRVLPRCVLINSAVVCKPWNSLSLKAESADWLPVSKLIYSQSSTTELMRWKTRFYLQSAYAFSVTIFLWTI